MNNILNCDHCNNKFRLEAKDINTKVIDDVEVNYFECNHCKHKYITTCTDKYILKLQVEYKKLVKEKAELIRDTVRSRHIHITKYDKKIKAIDTKKLSILEDMKRHSDMIVAKVKDRL